MKSLHKTTAIRLSLLSDEDAQRATDTYRELFPVFEVGHVKVFEGVVAAL